MSVRVSTLDSDLLLRTLAEFRFELRRFLHFSESSAVEEGLHPQQHQLLLQVAGAPEDAVVTIAYAAERLGLRHNSVVELVNRSEGEGLLLRAADAEDQRRALLRVTRKGRRALERLSEDHAREIHELAPRLLRTLEQICAHERAQSPERGRRKTPGKPRGGNGAGA
jgi:DNA-binding MarR family transcriptional regulator